MTAASPMTEEPYGKRGMAWAALAVAGVLAAGGWWYAHQGHEAPAAEDVPSVAGRVQPDVVRVAPDQLAAFDVGTLQQRSFANLQRTLGVIDFNQDRTVRVFSAQQGRVAQVLVKAGDEVRKGQTLFTVAVSDASQAASALISAAATLRAANATAKRAEALAQDSSIPQKEYQQAQADQQTAQAAYDAARQNLRLLELGEADIARIERERKVGIEVAVKSPISGRVVARAAQPGLLVQPGNDPAPVTVSDTGSLWMVANVPESEFRYYRPGQPVEVRVAAWPGKVFAGKVAYVGDSIDADSRRIPVRAEIADPQHLLRPQMTAEFSTTIAAPDQGIAAPAEAVVRRGDGADVVWVASGKDAKGPLFTQRPVVRGKADGGWVELVQGLAAGDQVARRNALFLSSLYETDAPAQ